MPMLGPWELIVILVIVVVIFGAGRLSQIGGAVGKSVREFRHAVQEEPPASAPVAPAQLSAPVVAETACPSCQGLNAVGLKFCGKCGSPLSQPVATSTVSVVENTCPSCATVNPVGQAFCGQCGTRLVRAA